MEKRFRESSLSIVWLNFFRYLPINIVNDNAFYSPNVLTQRRFSSLLYCNLLVSFIKSPALQIIFFDVNTFH